MCDLSRNDLKCTRTALRYVHDQIDVACGSTTWGYNAPGLDRNAKMAQERNKNL